MKLYQYTAEKTEQLMHSFYAQKLQELVQSHKLKKTSYVDGTWLPYEMGQLAS